MRRDAGIGVCTGIVISTWNLLGMYTTIPVGTWDIGRQVLFIVALVAVAVVAARTAREDASWSLTGARATVAAMSCAATVLGVYAVSTQVATTRIRQVPAFILDYTNNKYTSPAAYFADHYWALLQLQAFTWTIGAVGLAAVGTVVGRVAAHIKSRHDSA